MPLWLYFLPGMFEQKVLIWRGGGFADALMTHYVLNFCNWEIDGYASSSFLCNYNTQQCSCFVLFLLLYFFLRAFTNRWQTFWTGLKQSYLTPGVFRRISSYLILMIAVQPDVWKVNWGGCFFMLKKQHNWHGSRPCLLGLTHPHPLNCKPYWDQNSNTLAVKPARSSDRGCDAYKTGW